MPLLPYTIAEFPARNRWRVSNGPSTRTDSIDEIVHAFLTVGYRGVSGISTIGERLAAASDSIRRICTVPIVLKSENTSGCLIQTDRFRKLDGSEKGGLSYHLGMGMAKHFVSRLFDVPWLLHADLSRDQLGYWTPPGTKARGDLVGFSRRRRKWVIVEAKGWGRHPSINEIESAKDQAKMIRRVSGTRVGLHCASFTYFKRGPAENHKVLQTTLVDPPLEEGGEETGLDLEMTLDDLIKSYYSPIISWFHNEEGKPDYDGNLIGTQIPMLDLTLQIEPYLLKMLENSKASDLKKWFYTQEYLDLCRNGKVERDGLKVKLGKSWDSLKNPDITSSE